MTEGRGEIEGTKWDRIVREGGGADEEGKERSGEGKERRSEGKTEPLQAIRGLRSEQAACQANQCVFSFP